MKNKLNSKSNHIRVLRLLISITETNAAYNQFSLPVASEQDITICTYFRIKNNVSKSITIFPGDGTVLGFIRAIKSAVGNKEYDVIHAHTPHVGLLFIFASLILNPQLLYSTVYTFHSSYPNYKIRNRLMLFWVFALFRRVVCCSRSSYESLPHTYKWIAGSRLRFIPNGVDIDRIDQNSKRNQRKLAGREFTVVSVGRLTEIKCPHILLQAFHMSFVHPMKLVFIGEGALYKDLLSLSQNLGIPDSVIFTGLISRDQVHQYLLKADLFISTSSIEGLPIAVLEAMACRCPVVLSSIPPHREIANGAKFIPIISPQDVQGFATSIQKFQQMSNNKRALIGSQCRRIVENRFSLDRMLTQYEMIYRELN